MKCETRVAASARPSLGKDQRELRFAATLAKALAAQATNFSKLSSINVVP